MTPKMNDVTVVQARIPHLVEHITIKSFRNNVTREKTQRGAPSISPLCHDGGVSACAPEG